ncbi:uncharacterized protein TOT_040000984 [Theileria orientalis strain Shintoku]|uniref:Uncharacterized protein n=1 Tax=Theileria orientalis strain Shintoku TaxID=869250 RepID=J7M4S7_THEOR|nr:uncharacterized protein TOT_040000984 [Theileria orientalis strain Shintoku]BAM42480.1 uncharacterized protein TOT_040000984 [Theileria orientalis strain Shintoku]|eukprot:XP_009692781.1 uncharacterized protein TOT_040000984 [Theileria orientalis strain Shintoku]
MQNLQYILNRLKQKLKEKDKNYQKYKRFHDNILAIIQYKIINDSITKEDKVEKGIQYQLIGENNIIINDEQLILEDLSHTSNVSRPKEGVKDEEGKAKEVVIKEQRVVKLHDQIYVPLEYYNKLYVHQKKALTWLTKLHVSNLGGILADDMGLGKTITILSLINTLIYSSNLIVERGRTKAEDLDSVYRIMIVCNVTLLEQWREEINKWIFSNIKLYILHSNYDVNRDYYGINEESGDEVYLVGYEYLRVNIEYINNYEWKYLILDEGQKIRNPNSLITLAVKTVKTPHRIVISGSPIQNNLIELWSLVDFILPNYLGSLNSFIEEFVAPISSNSLNNKHINRLKLLILPYIFRTLKSNMGAKNDLFSKLTDPSTEVEGDDEAANDGDGLNKKSSRADEGGKSDRLDYGKRGKGNGKGEKGGRDESKCGGYCESEVAEERGRINQSIGEVDLPNKVERIILCNLTFEQYKLYVEVLNKFKYSSKGMTSQSVKMTKDMRKLIGKELTRDKHILKVISTLRKICNHPKLMFKQTQALSDTSRSSSESEARKKTSKRAGAGKWSSSKLNVCLKIIDIWHKEGSKVLVFTQTIGMLSIIYNELLKTYEREQIAILHGKITINNRNKVIEAFRNEENIFVMLLTTKVGGIGLNLTVATRIVIYDPDWNPMTDLQARERSYRIGQTKQVTIYRLVTANTIEEKIYQRQLYKCYLTNKILNHNNVLFYNKYINNLQYILSYPPPPAGIAMTRDEEVGEEAYQKAAGGDAKHASEDEDRFYKLLVNDDRNNNINSYIKYNDIISNMQQAAENNSYASLSVAKGAPSTRSEWALSRNVDKNRQLLYNLKGKNNKSIRYIITNQILHYFNTNSREIITTNRVSCRN